jgi:PTS system cellobiose-specific IIA component
MEGMELISFQMIAALGEAKQFIMQAIEGASKGDFEAANRLIEQCKEKIKEAHQVHFELIQKEANGEKVDIGLLFMHAEDQLLTTGLMKDMAEQFIKIYKKIYEKEA